MFPKRLLDRLLCPYCGSALVPERTLAASGDAIRTAVVACDCACYPLLEGILALRPDRSFARACDRLADGDAAGALLEALPSASAPGRLARRLARLPPLRTVFERREARDKSRFLEAPSFRDAVMWGRLPSYGHYLFHRYANPSFLAAIPVLLMFRGDAGRPILDLSAGAGHASYLLGILRPGAEVISADSDFANLLLARRFLVPGAALLCLDAEHPLPFSDGFLDGVFCGDAVYCYRSKVGLVRELERTVAPEGLWAFTRMWNTAAFEFSGFPMTAAQYLRLFERENPVLLPESAVFEQFVRELRLEIGVRPTPELERESAFTMLGRRSAPLGDGLHDLADAYADGWRDLSINPIYRVDERDDALELRVEWPSSAGLDRSLREDCAPVETVLPATARIERPLLERLERGEATPEDRACVRALLLEFVLVRLPGSYGQRPLPVAPGG